MLSLNCLLCCLEALGLQDKTSVCNLFILSKFELRIVAIFEM